MNCILNLKILKNNFRIQMNIKVYKTKAVLEIASKLKN